MKSSFQWIVVIATVIASVSYSRSEGSPRKPVPSVASVASVAPEISALLLSAHFSANVTELNKVAKNSGRTLRIAGFEVLKINSETFAYVKLESKLSANVGETYTYYGNIVGVLSAGPMGELIVESAYFRPAEELPTHP